MLLNWESFGFRVEGLGHGVIWVSQNYKGTFKGPDPYNTDYRMLGSTWGSPILGNHTLLGIHSVL